MSNTEKTSKFLSFILRHKPEEIGLVLDPQGWANIDELMGCARRHGTQLDREHIEQVVETSDKRRFIISDDGERIRANQGHSIPVDLGLVPVSPPDHLFHGTATRFIEAIRAEGLLPRARHHVHLSASRETAAAVGTRHGKLAMLEIRSGDMARAGHLFYVSANGVWLVDAVPTVFIRFPE
ncbi:RNA 2'-phosphotransferase [Viridibacterium curvum]|uniref:Probable RNA 2'-phosphotransferase n=1 Tax=Viridibacterium curvum TaxID=1101404 RepID=A0ABP9QH76_9RHOO